MSIKKSLRKTTLDQSNDCEKRNIFNTRLSLPVDQTEIDCLDMVTNSWGFTLINEYVFTGNTEKEMQDMFKQVEREIETEKNKKKNKDEQMFFLPNTKPLQYYLRSLPNEMTHKLQVTVDAKGFGVKAGMDITEGEMILPYIGVVSSEKDYDTESDYVMILGEHVKALSSRSCRLGKETTVTEYAFKIDSFLQGNLARFVNHSCNNSNCSFIEGWYGERLYRVLIADSNIKKGSEILYNYSMEIPVYRKLPTCYCEGTSPDKIHTFGVRPNERYLCKHWKDDPPCREVFATPFQKYHHEFFCHRVDQKVQCNECDDKPAYKSFAGLFKHRRLIHKLKGFPENLRIRKSKEKKAAERVEMDA